MARILVSEADPDVCRLIALLLERLGHEVIVLDSARGAAPPADLMVLEPDSSNGLDHARLARAAQPDLPILCFSILPEEADFLEPERIEYLPKPFALQDLRRSVDSTLALAASVA